MSTTTENSNATIEGTVRQTLTARGNGSYMTYAQPVIEALVTREQAISKALIEQASEVDLSENEVRSILTGAGLSVADPEPEAAEEGDNTSTQQILDAISGLGSRIDNLERLARSHGLR